MSPHMRTGFTLREEEVRVLVIASHTAPPHAGEVWLDRWPREDWPAALGVHHALVMVGALEYLGTNDVPPVLVGSVKETRRYRITQFGRALLEEHLAQSFAES